MTSVTEQVTSRDSLRVEDIPIGVFRSFADQNPSGLDTPLKLIYSGVTEKTTGDEIVFHANGDIEVMKTGSYFFRVAINMGREGEPGTAALLVWSETAGQPSTATVHVSFDDGNVKLSREFTASALYPEGVIANLWMARDSGGIDAGGLRTYPASPTLSGLGVADSPSISVSAYKRIGRWL